MMPNRPRLARLLPALTLLLAGGAGTVHAGPLGCFRGGETLSIRPGETNEGDLYYTGTNVDVAGVQDGDLIGVATIAVISGEVKGDLIFAVAQSLEISGTVHDSVRVATANGMSIMGTIEGDLLAVGQQISIHPRAHITGNVYILSSLAIVDGTIDGDLHVTAGKVQFSATVGRDARLTADSIKIDPPGRIAGDLVYSSRKQLDDESLGVVQGAVTYKEKVDKQEGDHDKKRGNPTTAVLVFLWKTVSSLLVGFVALALFRRAAPALSGSLDREAMLGALIGFGTSLIVPAAAVLSVALIISLPLGLVTLLLFVIALYVAKLPVALWLGHRALRAVGQASPSPFLALTIGVIALYLVFLVPFYVGTFAWWLTTWLGLGAMVLTLRNRTQPAAKGGAVATPLPPAP